MAEGAPELHTDTPTRGADAPVSEIERVQAVGDLVATKLLGLSAEDRVIIVVDETGVAENGDIARAILEHARASGAECLLVEMDDVPVDGNGNHVEHLPAPIAEGLPACTAIVSLTRTTSAPLPHHRVPIELVRSGRLRGVFMVKRSREDLLSESVLGVDFDYMSQIADRWQSVFQDGSEVHVTSALGTDFTASINGMPSHRSDFAHVAGKMSPINWGEVYQGPVVGSMNGVAVVDGPILGYGWPGSPVTVEFADGLAVRMDGPDDIVTPLWELVTATENGQNVAELALGINPRANGRSANVYKKGLGRMHFALGNGLVYNQDVDSEIHIDFIMPTPTVSVDGQVVVVDGKPAP